MSAGEWIKYDGKGMPVTGDVMVEVLLDWETFDDFSSDPRLAEDWNLTIYGSSVEITHYKVIA